MNDVLKIATTMIIAFGTIAMFTLKTLMNMDIISLFWMGIILLVPILILVCGSNKPSQPKTRENETSFLRSIYCYDTKPRVRTREDETPGYFAWRTRVLKRDGFTCVKCGSNENLQVHHLWGYKENPELAIVDNNGVTLCKDCHEQYHNINGYYDINPRDFEDFMK